eukprot:139270_1
MQPEVKSTPPHPPRPPPFPPPWQTVRNSPYALKARHSRCVSQPPAAVEDREEEGGEMYTTTRIGVRAAIHPKLFSPHTHSPGSGSPPAEVKRDSSVSNFTAPISFTDADSVQSAVTTRRRHATISGPPTTVSLPRRSSPLSVRSRWSLSEGIKSNFPDVPRGIREEPVNAQGESGDSPSWRDRDMTNIEGVECMSHTSSAESVSKGAQCPNMQCAKIVSSLAQFCDACGTRVRFIENCDSDLGSHTNIFADRLWDKLPTVISQSKVARKNIASMIQYLKELATVEAAYGKALLKLSKNGEIQEQRTLAAGWDSIRKAHHFAALRHCARASELQSDCISRLTAIHASMLEVNSNMESSLRNADRELSASMQKHEKAKSKLRFFRDKKRTTYAKLEMLHSKEQVAFSKLMKKQDKLKQMKTEIAVAVKATADSQKVVLSTASSRITSTASVLAIYQQMESDRLEATATCLQDAINNQLTDAMEIAGHFSVCLDTVNNIDARLDIVSFVEASESGQACPYMASEQSSSGSPSVQRPVVRTLSLSEQTPLGYTELPNGNVRFRVRSSAGVELQLVIAFDSKCVYLQDMGGNLQREMSPSEISRVDVNVIGHLRLSPCDDTSVSFHLGKETIQLVMQSSPEKRLYLCESLRAVCPDMFLLGDDIDPQTLRFAVTRSSMFSLGPKKSVITLDERRRAILWDRCFPEIPVSSVVKVERSLNSTTKLTVNCTNESNDFGVRFETSEARERFLAALWRLSQALSIAKVEENEPVPDTLQIWVGSWNLGGCSTYEKSEDVTEPRDQRDLSPWIPPEKDVYVVGFQECGSKEREEWIRYVLTHINFVNKKEFMVLTARNMMEIVVFIVVSVDIEKSISCVETARVATGIGGVLGNKGGIGISLCIEQTSFLFVLAHFAARAERLEQRKSNFHEIVKGLDLGNNSVDLLEQFNHVIWFGDLNYRIELAFHETLRLIGLEDWPTLMSADQLQAEMQKHNVFSDFSEAQVAFHPTYRMERTSKSYNNKRSQAPSYTDRILWKSLPNSTDLMCSSYDACRDMFGSDHRPVCAIFKFAPRIPFFESSCRWFQTRDSIYTIRFADLTASLPTVQLSPGLVDLMCLAFGHAYTETVALSGHASFRSTSRDWVWTDSNHTCLRPYISDPDYLVLTHVSVTVKSSANNRYFTVGHCTVGLHEAFSEDPRKFEASITRHGHVLGKLTGTIHAATTGRRRN